MVIPESRSCSEMKAATELPISERPTLSSVPSAIPVAPPPEQEEESPRSERIMNLEERVARLLDENRALLNERKQEREIGQHRIQRANECLQHARDARTLIRAYVDACTKVDYFAALPIEAEEMLQNGLLQLEVARLEEDEAYQALVAFISKPL